jgi:hypothetical protein
MTTASPNIDAMLAELAAMPPAQALRLAADMLDEYSPAMTRAATRILEFVFTRLRPNIAMMAKPFGPEAIRYYAAMASPEVDVVVLTSMPSQGAINVGVMTRAGTPVSADAVRAVGNALAEHGPLHIVHGVCTGHFVPKDANWPVPAGSR